MDWECPYCQVVVFNGQNKLNHLAKHEPAIRKLLRDKMRLGWELLSYIRLGGE